MLSLLLFLAFLRILLSKESGEIKDLINDSSKIKLLLLVFSIAFLIGFFFPI